MKLLFWTVLMIPVAMAAGEDKPAQRQPAPPAAKKQPVSQAKQYAALTLPEGAKEVDPGTYKYTDPQGKNWIYRKGLFGLTRYEDRPVVVNPETQIENLPVVTEEGDKVKFVWKTLMGPSILVVKKSELSEDQKALYERVKARQVSASPLRERQ